MKKRIAFAVVLTLSLLTLVGRASASATTGRSITGSYQWIDKESGFRAWGEMMVQEIGPNGEARGWINELEFKPWEEEPWVLWETEAICVGFYDDPDTGHLAAARQLDWLLL